MVVLEKGPWVTEKDFFKEEVGVFGGHKYVPDIKDEYHTFELRQKGHWKKYSSGDLNLTFWNGNVVGGSSNFMSGYFHRLKPKDFALNTHYPQIMGANIVDWPITYQELEPFYTEVDQEVGVSGVIPTHRFAEFHSQPFPFPPTIEHPLTHWFDTTFNSINVDLAKTPRAILSKATPNRKACEYSGFCGGYGCHTGAKGSARAALLDKAVVTGHCQIIPNSQVFNIETNDKSAVKIHYFSNFNRKKTIEARIYVVACQAIESVRLLLNSKNRFFPKGLGNDYDQVGKNIIFSAGGSAKCTVLKKDLPLLYQSKAHVTGPFFNRNTQEYYEIKDDVLLIKGGTIDFFIYENNVGQLINQTKVDKELVWGNELTHNINDFFKEKVTITAELFLDWSPNDDCFVSLDKNKRDRWGMPVANVRINSVDHDEYLAQLINKKIQSIFNAFKPVKIEFSHSVLPPTNLQQGGCRFGLDPKTSVLDKNCKIHSLNNVYVTDGSFMPTGGSVPPTYTIYANSFRVAKHLISLLLVK